MLISWLSHQEKELMVPKPVTFFGGDQWVFVATKSAYFPNPNLNHVSYGNTDCDNGNQNSYI